MAIFNRSVVNGALSALALHRMTKCYEPVKVDDENDNVRFVAVYESEGEVFLKLTMKCAIRCYFLVFDSLEFGYDDGQVLPGSAFPICNGIYAILISHDPY